MIFIAVPFFKNASFLEETLKSVLSQTSSQWNAVVLDDSIEATEAVSAKQCVERLNDPRIQYLKNPKNIGMARNWNQGLDLGKSHPQSIGTTILHADDRLLPLYVETMLHALTTHPNTAAFFCETVIINGKGSRTFSFTDVYKKWILPQRKNGMITLSGIQGIETVLPGNFMFCPTFCYRNSALHRGFNSELKMVADYEFTLDLLLHNGTLQGIYSQPLFEYRRHSSNTTKILNESLVRFHEEKALYLDLAQKLEKQGHSKLAQQTRQLSIIKKNLLFLIVSSFFSGKLSLTRQYSRFLYSMKSDHQNTHT